MSHAESEMKFASSVCVNKSRNVRSVKKSSGCVSFVMLHTSFALIDVTHSHAGSINATHRCGYG